MSMFIASTADLVSLLATASGFPLVASQYSFTAPKPTVAGDNSVHNTKVRVTALAGNTYHAPGSTFVMFYDRLSLALLSSFDFVGLPANPGTTILSNLATIVSMTGIPFTSADINDGTVGTNGGTGLPQITLVAQTTSLGWTDSFTLAMGALPPLSTAFSNNIIQWS